MATLSSSIRTLSLLQLQIPPMWLDPNMNVTWKINKLTHLPARKTWKCTQSSWVKGDKRTSIHFNIKSPIQTSSSIFKYKRTKTRKQRDQASIVSGLWQWMVVCDQVFVEWGWLCVTKYVWSGDGFLWPIMLVDGDIWKTEHISWLGMVVCEWVRFVLGLVKGLRATYGLKWLYVAK